MIMLKSGRQLQHTKKLLRQFIQRLKEVKEEYSADKEKGAFYGQGFREQIKQFKTQIAEYEKLKKTPLPKVLRAHDPVEMSRQLVRLRLARGLSQAKLAVRVGCKQSDISRLEREDYQGYTVKQLEKIAENLDAKIEIDLIPART